MPEPASSSPPRPGGDAPSSVGADVDAAEAPEPYEDESLLAFTPTRWWQVAGPVALQLAAGAAAIVLTPVVVRVDVVFLHIAIPFFGVYAIVSGLIWAGAGWRAARTLTVGDVRRYAVVQLLSVWIASVLFGLAAVVGASRLFLSFAIGWSMPMRYAAGGTTRTRGTLARDLLRRLRPWIMGELIAGIVLPLVAAVIAFAMHASDAAVSSYVANAIVVPILSLVGLVLLLRRSPPSGRTR